MKRALALTLVLVVALAAGLGALAAGANEQRDQVVLSAVPLTGRAEAARGLEIRLPAAMDRRLFWDTTVRLTPEPEAATDFRAYLTEQEDAYQPPVDGLRLDSYLEFGMSFRDSSPDAAKNQTGIARAYQELYDATPAGEYGSTVILLKDYLDYYPLSMTLDLPEVLLDMTSGTYSTTDLTGMTWEDLPPDYKVFADLQNYLKIPVVDEEAVEISLEKDENGRVWSHGSSGHGDTDSFYLESTCVVASDAVYFTFSPYTREGNLVDTSQIPGGYGIYRLPYDNLAELGPYGVRSEELSTFFPLDPAARILHMALSEDGRRLVLHSRENGRYMITVIDLARRDTVQRLDLCPSPEWSGCSILQGDGYLVTALYDGALCVLEQSLDGTCQTQLITQVYTEEGSQYWNYGTAIPAWDGERLALVLPDSYGMCGFQLAVYTAEGIQYCADYNSSLESGGYVSPVVRLREHRIRAAWTDH